MAEHHYLPTLRKGTNIIQPPVAGSWLSVTPRDIEALSQGLEVNDGARRRAATSLPDVWARPLLVHSAIRPHSAHPLRQELLDEWRGLLSLIALSDYYKLKLELEPAVIDDRGGRFARALTELRPRPVTLEEGKGYDWLDVLLLRVDGVTVGALSPLTLVYTGVRKLPQTIPLVEDGRLRQPTDAAELRYVAQWVQSLMSRLDAAMWTDQKRNADTHVVEDIRTLLAAWLTSLRTSLGLTASEPLEQPGVAFKIAEPGANGAWPRLHTYTLYRELLRPAEIVSDQRSSDLLLAHSRGTRGRSIVVITTDLLARDVKVWTTLKSKDLGAIDDPQAALGRYFQTESGDRIDRQNLGADNALWIRPEKFFLTDTLLISAGDAPLLAEGVVVRDPKDRRYILPFRKEILEFFTPEELIERLAPRFEPVEGGVRFLFNLPLDSPIASKVVVQKDFRFKEPKASQGTIRRFDPTPVYVFPRYRTPHWRRYFVFSAGKASAIEPLTAPGAQVSVVARKRGECTIHQISGEGAYPEAVGVAVDEGKAAGLVLLAKAADQPGLAGDRDMVIGIDYGTSNTNVYLLPPDATQPHAWTIDLRHHIQPIFEAAGSSRVVQDHFLPLEPVKLPVATNLRVFDTAVVEHMLLDYFVHFSGDDDYRLPDNVYSDIKWQDIGKTQQFVKSLLMLLLLEVVEARAKRFKIIFSYPRAFSANQRQRLEQTWQAAVNELTVEPGRLLNVSNHAEADVLIPRFSGVQSAVEAVAAGEFFASRNAQGKYENITISNPYDRASVETTAVCIDVGGGTTDICIWHGNQRILDASILLAGRQIGSWIRGNATVRELLFTREAALALKEVEAKPAMFSARLNQVLKRQEEEITKNLILHGTHPDIERMRRMLAIEFGAIVFYTATLLVAANRIGRIQGKIASDVSSGISLHWGGNASKMVRWIDYGKFSSDGIAARTLRAVLRNALSDGKMTSPAQGVDNKQSPGHKSEVAGGLIVWNDVQEFHAAQAPTGFTSETDDPEMVAPGAGDNPASRADIDVLLMGEGVETSEGSIAYDEPVSVSRLFPVPGQTVVRAVSMERLGRFLEIINHVGLRSGLFAEGKQVQLTEQLRAHIGRQVRGEFSAMAMLNPSNRVVEPAFISEVRSLLDVLTNQA
jgi:hypothetical protein